MSQFSNDIDSLSVKGAEKLDPATFDRISGYIQSGKLRSEDVDSLSKGVQHVDSAAFDRISKAIESENIKQPTQQVPQKPKTAGDKLLEFGRKGVEATFPRLTQNTTGKITPSEIGKDLLRGSLDALSLGPRYTMAGPQTLYQTIRDVATTGDLNTLKNIPEKVLENVKRTETPTGTGVLGLAEDIARGPFVALPGAGQIGTGVVGAASRLPLGVGAKVASIAPRIGEAVGPRLGALAAGVGDIALGAGMGTAESVARNEGVSQLGVGIGGALGALNPLGRAFKSGADYISDRAFTNKYVKQMQDLYIHGNDAEKQFAKEFLDKYTANQIPGTVRDELDYQLLLTAKKIQDDNIVTEAGNLARKKALNERKTPSEALILATNAENLARESLPFPGSYTDFPRMPADKTLAQGTRELTKWKSPNVPGFGVGNRFIETMEKSSDITGLPGIAAWLSLLSTVGSPYFAYEAIKKNPHAISNATRFVPRQTGTAIRNLGTGLFGREEQ